MTEASRAPADRRGPGSEREPNFVLARFERRVLPWLARRLPSWVTPDHLTLLGILAAIGISAAYLLSNEDPAWLWAVNALLVVHWFGDSLDGTLARVRRIERPKYGYYLDHLTDAFSTVAIGLGIGLSPYMLLSIGLAIVIAYLVLSINVYLETHVFGVFRLGYSWVGPTEARAVLFVVNGLLAAGAGLDFTIREIGLTPLDVIGVLAAATMIALLLVRVGANLRTLAREEPAGRVRD
ncbi:MAG TPA: CDP-alcohol phosphatidyltransferase family protein [Gemmatimonadota bacterium]|jgi:phosphatidylglycerophosphate synthase